jgi:hypothetical protein
VTARAWRWLTAIVVGALTWTAAGGVAVAELPAEAVVSAGFAPALHDEISSRLDKTAIETGLAALLRERRAPTLRRPLDSGLSWGASALYCPHYWPTLYPGANLDQLCGSDYYQSQQLYQRNSENPFVIAREQFMALADSSDERMDRLPWGAAYAALHRSGAEWATDTTLALLKRPQYLRAEVFADLAAPIVERFLPQSLTSVEAGEGQVPVDVRVFSNVSYDSVASAERTLLTAAGRGIRAIAIADRSRLDGAQATARTAERLKSEGRLPRDFVVIPGQVVYSHAGAVLALFVDDPILDGMTMATTLEAIHSQGGLAYLLHPGEPGGPERLERLPFDGYLLQPDMFEMFRTLFLMYDPRYIDKPGLTASNALASGTAGLPYVLVDCERLSADSLRQAMRERKVAAAGALYLPWMALASFRPMARGAQLLNNYFLLHRWAESTVARRIGAGTISISTSWDAEVREMMNLNGLPDGIRDLLDGSSPLLHRPHLGYVVAEYAFFRVGYDRNSDTAFLEASLTW